MADDDVVRRASLVRGKASARLVDALGSETPGPLARHIEKCIWNATLRGFLPHERYWDNHMVRYKYTTKVLGVAFNLKNPKNPCLLMKVKSGEISPPKLVSMTPYELFPEMWAPVFERIAHKQLRRQLTTDVANAPDGMLQCRSCKSMKTTYYQMQTRSADEPMTVFAQCLNCQRRWKQ